MAAGRGERLWPLTENTPKPLLPLANKPILERTLDALAHAGIHQIILVVGFRDEKIRVRFGKGEAIGSEIRYVKQKTQKGTADALGTCSKELQGEDTFLVVYGDDHYETTVPRTFLAKAKRNKGITIGTANVQDASPFGKIQSRRGLVTEIREKASKAEPGQVNAGIYLMDQSLLEANEWAVGSERPLSKGTVEKGVNIRGPAVLEEGSVVKAGSYLEGPVHVGKRCQIGPNAYLRPYSSLGDDVKVGAGCEIKNTIVMNNTRIPHLSYVGDSILGEACSLGAGTITANLRFDEAQIKSKVSGSRVDSGRKKLGAVLGDGVKTGINVSTFPGVKVGRGSWIGPGAIVDHDVSSNAKYKAS